MSTQQDINAIRAQRLANTHDPLALMANTQTPFHPDQSSHITYIQHPQPHNHFVQQPSFNTNYMPQPMQNLKDSSDPTTAMNKALALMAKAFKFNTIPTNNNQRSSLIPRKIANQYGNVNVVATPAEGNGNGVNGNLVRCYNCRGEGHYNSNCTLKPRKRDVAYLQQQLQITQEEEAGI
ncbi:zf-CCHC domain-containing protein [Tanacetum coccineum]